MVLVSSSARLFPPLLTAFFAAVADLPAETFTFCVLPTYNHISLMINLQQPNIIGSQALECEQCQACSVQMLVIGMDRPLKVKYSSAVVRLMPQQFRNSAVLKPEENRQKRHTDVLNICYGYRQCYCLLTADQQHSDRVQKQHKSAEHEHCANSKCRFCLFFSGFSCDIAHA